MSPGRGCRCGRRRRSRRATAIAVIPFQPDPIWTPEPASQPPAPLPSKSRRAPDALRASTSVRAVRVEVALGGGGGLRRCSARALRDRSGCRGRSARRTRRRRCTGTRSSRWHALVSARRSYPVVTSFSAVGRAYGYDAGYVPATGAPAMAYIPAMSGAETLVPPKTCQADENGAVGGGSVTGDAGERIRDGRDVRGGLRRRTRCRAARTASPDGAAPAAAAGPRGFGPPARGAGGR